MQLNIWYKLTLFRNLICVIVVIGRMIRLTQNTGFMISWWPRSILSEIKVESAFEAITVTEAIIPTSNSKITRCSFFLAYLKTNK